MAEWRKSDIVLIALLAILPACRMSAAGTGDQSKETPAAAQDPSAEEQTDEQAEESNEQETKKEQAKTEAASSSKKTAAATSTTSPASQADSPMVRAAKASGGSKGRASFTDADLGKAKGSIIVIESTGREEMKTADPKPKNVDENKIRDARIAEVEKTQVKALRAQKRKQLTEKIAAVKLELASLEDDFYTTEDDDWREEVESKFAAKQKELQDLQKQLADMGNP